MSIETKQIILGLVEGTFVHILEMIMVLAILSNFNSIEITLFNVFIAAIVGICSEIVIGCCVGLINNIFGVD